ncbi:MAG: hypothetical protein GKS00_02765 [Alphaproteobacteria bacterium]|nr:hypothetical protein [Alphaproteobacteria bacterium]
MNRYVIITLSLLAIVLALGGGGYYLTHYVDWVRVYYKRFKAPSAYVFDEIRPSFKKTDPAKLIRIRSRGSADQIRRALIQTIWGPGGLPAQTMPEPYDGKVPERLTPLPGVASSQQLRIPVDLGYAAYIFILKPETPNGRLVIYQHGYAGTVDAMTPLLTALIEEGYTVAASNYPEYGPNQFPRVNLERFGLYSLSHDRIVSVHPRPIRFYVEPVIVAINALSRDGAYSRIDMLGFSAGGWIATLAAAVDPRIQGTFTVAGGYPLYLRLDNFEKSAPPPQLFQPLLQAANYLEMYVLAAEGPARQLTQIFNRYDRCCYRNTIGKLYEPAVRDVVGTLGTGQFRVLIDETHADHKVSDWAIARIIEGLAAAARPVRE